MGEGGRCSGEGLEGLESLNGWTGRGAAQAASGNGERG